MVKCIVFDLDNTIWNGTLDANDNVKLNEKIIEYIKKAFEKGIVLAIASKNNFEEAYKLAIDEETMTATITVPLAEGDVFKIAQAGWSGEVSSDELGAAFSKAADGNITVLTAGTYQIVVSNLDSTPSLTITAVTE